MILRSFLPAYHGIINTEELTLPPPSPAFKFVRVEISQSLGAYFLVNICYWCVYHMRIKYDYCQQKTSQPWKGLQIPLQLKEKKKKNHPQQETKLMDSSRRA